MQRVPRLRMSAVDKVVIWEQWTQGASLSEIGRTLGRVPAAVFHVVRARRDRAARSLALGPGADRGRS